MKTVMAEAMTVFIFSHVNLRVYDGKWLASNIGTEHVMPPGSG